MSKVIFTVDSTSDFPQELAREKGVIVINQPVFMGGKQYTDNVDIVPEDIFRFVEETGEVPTTSCPSYQQYKDTWTPEIEKGNIIMHFNLSSELGANYQNACLAAKDFPAGKVFAVDSRTATVGVAILILYAIDLINEGLSVSEVYEKVLARREDVHLSIMLENLKYMRKSGRCKGVQLLVTQLLKIRVELGCIEGKLKIQNKHRGNMPHAIKQMMDSLRPLLDTSDKKTIFVGQIGGDNKNVDLVEQYIRDNYNFENVYRIVAGSTITCHIGNGGLGIIFFKK